MRRHITALLRIASLSLLLLTLTASTMTRSCPAEPPKTPSAMTRAMTRAATRAAEEPFGNNLPHHVPLSLEGLQGVRKNAAGYFRTAPQSLLAHWKFDEQDHSPVVVDSSGHPEMAIKADLPRERGVFGRAIRLEGSHQLRVKSVVPSAQTKAISFSAWVRPSALGGYREIFRQECAERLLFAFQQGGTILSLGLNIGGYVECDASINPAMILDGTWHHCAATYDGLTMRVFVDGEEVGALERPGFIATNTTAPAFIASSGGTGEHFHGMLDDLQVFSSALSPNEIAAIYGAGVNSIAARLEQLGQQLSSIYSPADTFATTLANTTKKLSQSNVAIDRELVGVMLTRLKATFPDDYDIFVNRVGINPFDYVARALRDRIEPTDTRQSNRAGDRTVNGAAVPVAEQRDYVEADRLIELMLEYRPLTDDQWQRQSPAQQQHWHDVDVIASNYERLKSQGSGARYSPEWIEIILEAGRRIDFRPKVSEAVAPYQTPATTATRSLTKQEASATLQKDWLHQVDGTPTRKSIKAEIQWARKLAKRIATSQPSQDDLTAQLNELDRLAEQAQGSAVADTQLYFAVRRVKRAIMFANPVVNFESVLFVDMPFPQGSEWPHETRHRLGYMAVPGGRLLVLDGLSPTGQLRQLMPQESLHGSFWRPDLSFDASKVLFCFKPHNEKAFHLYEINLDGSALNRLTDGPYDDLDPIYLPDDQHIMFSTTRGHTYVRCMPPTNAYVLARCDSDGKNVYLTSRNNEPDYLPSVMHDGRVVYTRWEYTDKPLWRAQGLWTCNPDGSQVSTLWGNQSVWPDLLKDVRAIPGSKRVMFTGSAHHDWFSGSVGIIDPDKGFNFPDGLTKVTADQPWPESGNGPVDPVESPDYHSAGSYTGYYSPFPLSERDFLVSAKRDGKFVLYLMDVDGNRELIYEGDHNVLHALPLRSRRRPPAIADRVDWPEHDERLTPSDGVIYSANIYHGAPSQLQGKGRYLRVLNIEPKTYTYWYKRPYLSTGPVVSAVQSEGVKRVLGTVPIEKDGSIAFSAPSGMALHFQILNEDFRALQTMRSFTGVMPGERRGCLGCHESHSTAPQYSGHNQIDPIALSKPPHQITPPPWGDQTVGYDRFVRPALTKYCGECHEGNGDATQVLDLTPRPGFLFFDESYLILTGRPSWGKAYKKPENPEPGLGIANMIMVEGYDPRDPAAYSTLEPMTQLSYKSRLIDIASSGEHYDVKFDAMDLRKLIAWVDTMCPYRGDQEVRAIDDPVFQGVDWLSIRPLIKTAPKIIRPGPVD